MTSPENNTYKNVANVIIHTKELIFSVKINTFLRIQTPFSLLTATPGMLFFRSYFNSMDLLYSKTEILGKTLTFVMMWVGKKTSLI